MKASPPILDLKDVHQYEIILLDFAHHIFLEEATKIEIKHRIKKNNKTD